MRLSELLNGKAGAPDAALSGQDIDILGLSADSRDVRKGDLFAALNGLKARGSDFIAEAAQRGAVAVLAPPGTALPAEAKSLSLVTDPNPRRRLALMAARFFPEQPETIVAVTGTNGKSSVASFTRQIWANTGRRAASMGSLGVEADGIAFELPHTTPEPIALHRTLSDLAQRGIDHLAMEASSHGLDQHRLDGVRVRAAAFTNLSRDHLDYHATLEQYLAAKLRLFDSVMAEGGSAVLNADVPEFDTFLQACRARRHQVLSFGAKGADIRLARAEPYVHGQKLRIEVGGKAHDVGIALPGAFQASNVLAALGLALGCGLGIEAAIEALPELAGVRGRLQRIARLPGGAVVYVDYAHTPDALATVLQALRPYADRRLVVVFGCGGDRDPGKRPLMGEIASRLADEAVVTDDNPRGEDPASIRSQILAACPGGREIGDRGEAIRTALRELEPGDLLLIAGKGHERGQIVGDAVIPFDDAAVAQDAAAALAGSTG